MSTQSQTGTTASDFQSLKNTHAENAASIGKNLSEKPVTEKTVPANPSKRKLVKKHQVANPLLAKIWLFGHISTLVFGSISLLFQVFWLPNKWYINSISYRLALATAIASLSMTTNRRYGFAFLPSFTTLVANENFQYIVLATLWFFTFQSAFKLIPYVLLSLIHVTNHFNVSVIASHSDFIGSLIAYDELLLIVYLFVKTICFQHTAGYQLTIFLIFYWLRILYNSQTTALFCSLVDLADYKFKDVKNPKFQKVWTRLKLSIKRRQEDGL